MNVNYINEAYFNPIGTKAANNKTAAEKLVSSAQKILFKEVCNIIDRCYQEHACDIEISIGSFDSILTHNNMGRIYRASKNRFEPIHITAGNVLVGNLNFGEFIDQYDSPMDSNDYLTIYKDRIKERTPQTMKNYLGSGAGNYIKTYAKYLLKLEEEKEEKQNTAALEFIINCKFEIENIFIDIENAGNLSIEFKKNIHEKREPVDYSEKQVEKDIKIPFKNLQKIITFRIGKSSKLLVLSNDYIFHFNHRISNDMYNDLGNVIARAIDCNEYRTLLAYARRRDDKVQQRARSLYGDPNLFDNTLKEISDDIHFYIENRNDNNIVEITSEGQGGIEYVLDTNTNELVPYVFTKFNDFTVTGKFLLEGSSEENTITLTREHGYSLWGERTRCSCYLKLASNNEIENAINTIGRKSFTNVRSSLYRAFSSTERFRKFQLGDDTKISDFIKAMYIIYSKAGLRDVDLEYGKGEESYSAKLRIASNRIIREVKRDARELLAKKLQPTEYKDFMEYIEK